MASIAASFTGPNITARPIRIRASAATQAASSSSSLYQVLGIQKGATCKEIKAAYRKLARVLHPDAAYYNHHTTTNDTSSFSDFDFIKLHEAYETLSDPDKRAHYDRSLLWRATFSPPAASGFSGYSNRRWETDQCW